MSQAKLRAEPLNVRCARALGCDPLIYNHGRAECLCADHQHARDPGLALKPYGEDTPEGWACTGPLIQRFGLQLVAPRPDVPVWGCLVRGCLVLDTARIGTGPHPCAAVGAWVAQWGEVARRRPRHAAVYRRGGRVMRMIPVSLIVLALSSVPVSAQGAAVDLPPCAVSSRGDFRPTPAHCVATIQTPTGPEQLEVRTFMPDARLPTTPERLKAAGFEPNETPKPRKKGGRKKLGLLLLLLL